MKKLMLAIATVVAFSCGGDNRNQSDRSSEGENAEENVDENSGENISPQLEDSADRFEVDTVKSATSAGEEKKDLDKDN